MNLAQQVGRRRRSKAKPAVEVDVVVDHLAKAHERQVGAGDDASPRASRPRPLLCRARAGRRAAVPGAAAVPATVRDLLLGAAAGAGLDLGVAGVADPRGTSPAARRSPPTSASRPMASALRATWVSTWPRRPALAQRGARPGGIGQAAWPWPAAVGGWQSNAVRSSARRGHGLDGICSPVRAAPSCLRLRRGRGPRR